MRRCNPRASSAWNRPARCVRSSASPGLLAEALPRRPRPGRGRSPWCDRAAPTPSRARASGAHGRNAGSRGATADGRSAITWPARGRAGDVSRRVAREALGRDTTRQRRSRQLACMRRVARRATGRLLRRSITAAPSLAGSAPVCSHRWLSSNRSEILPAPFGARRGSDTWSGPLGSDHLGSDHSGSDHLWSDHWGQTLGVDEGQTRVSEGHRVRGSTGQTGVNQVIVRVTWRLHCLDRPDVRVTWPHPTV